MIKKKIVIVVIMAVILTIFSSCDGDGKGNIEGTWKDSDSIFELTLTENKFTLIRNDLDIVITGTFVLISDEEIKFVAEYENDIAFDNEQISSFSCTNNTMTIGEDVVLMRKE